MKQLILTFSVSIFLFCSCAEKPNDKSEKLSENLNSEQVDNKSDAESVLTNSEVPDDIDTALYKVYLKAKETFPTDSASLYRFYFKWNSSNTPEKIQKQIDRLEALLTKQSVDRYRKVENNLIPLLKEIVNANTISQHQAENLVSLYSDYDNFRGESLHSKLLTENDNYLLVWEAFRIISRESETDTCYINSLIVLDNNIRTNAELAESMIDFIIVAIKNNPKGFLDMYSLRNNEAKKKFANYISHYDVVDKELLSTFTEMSKNEKNEKYRKTAHELIQNFSD